MSNLVTKYIAHIKGLDYSGVFLNYQYWTIITIAHICWWLIYGFIHFFIKINHKTQKEINDTKNRIVSIIHASLIFCLCLYDVLFFEGEKCGSDNYFFQNFILAISFAYFAYDLIACILLDCSDIQMIYHHLFVMSGYYTGLSFNNSANEMMRALVVAEVSNPIMHLRMIIKNFGLKNTKFHVLLDYAYMTTYLIARLIYGTKVIIFTDFCWNNLLIVKIAGTFVYVQSLLFSKRMLHIAKHRYKEYLERKRKGIRLFWFSHNKQIEDLDYYKKSVNKKDAYVP